MKKPVLFVSAAVLSLSVLAGCGGSSTSVTASSFGAVSAGDAGITIFAENADPESAAASALTIGEGEQLLVDLSGMTEGKLEIKLTEEATKEAVPSVTVSARDSMKADVPAGEYEIEITVLEKANGEGEVRAEAK